MVAYFEPRVAELGQYPSVSEHDRHAGVWAVNLHIEFVAIRAAE